MVYGQEFLYSNGNDADLFLLLGKIPMILLGMLGGIFVYLWSRDLYGKKAAMLALFLFAFSPNILAHTRIIQTDIGITTFMTMTFYFFWKFLKEFNENSYALNKQSKKYLIFTGVALGLGMATKFTGLFFIPIMGVLLGLKILLENKHKDTETHQIKKNTIIKLKDDYT